MPNPNPNKLFQIALIGNPNCGKTTLFNNLTGARQKIGNWPGVTVEKKTGVYNYNNQEIAITDLPGIYSLSPAPQNNSPTPIPIATDQEITNSFIKYNNIDLYINILDASNLKRNLYLTLQLRELGLPCLVILNMTDKSEFIKLEIDTSNLTKQLSTILNCPVIITNGTKNIKNNTIDIKNNIALALNKFNKINLNLNNTNIFNKLGLNLNSITGLTDLSDLSDLENLDIIITNLSKLLSAESPESINLKNTHLNTYGLALEYIESDIINQPDSSPYYYQIQESKEKLRKLFQEDPDIIIADLRYKIINQIYNQIYKINNNTKKTNNKITLSEHIDNIVLNKYLGIPIFFILLYLTFESAIGLGEQLKQFFEIPAQYLVNNFFILITQVIPLPININIITNLNYGLTTGLSTVVGFIPQIAIIFILLTCLEDSGYMARAAFIMDRLMLAVGLPGKSFLPLIISFGCNVPAIMSTRTLHNHRDRILTCLMSPFMSCSARLAIFIVFASAFFPTHAALMVFILYLAGIIIALLTGVILKKTILLNQKTPFILELPSYNLPNIKTILITSSQHVWGFITRAGKLIIPICIFLQFINNINYNGQWLNTSENQSINQSILARFSKTITPILSPIGIEQDNWPATVGLITGSLAKEVVIGTLNTLYTNTDTPTLNITKNLLSTADPESFSKTSYQKLNQAFPSTIAAFAYCLFILLYIPCLSTFSVLIKEIGHKWAMMSLLWSIDIAYCSATIVYQSSTIILNPLRFITVVSFIVTIHLIIYQYLKSGKLNNFFNIKHHAHVTAT